MRDSIPDAAVVVPTYNEADTLADVVARVRGLSSPVDVLVVDDASPDGTGALADDLARNDPGIRVLHRPTKAGLGPAYRAGFGEALALGYDIVAQMDADGSHPVSELPALVDLARGGAVAIGSRRVAGGNVDGWSPRRDLLSVYGSRYAQRVCGIGIHDATSGFRAWPAKALDRIDVTAMRSSGFVFQVETILAAVDAGFETVEIPIRFSERAAGRSKLSAAIVLEAFWRTTLWGVRRQRPA